MNRKLILAAALLAAAAGAGLAAAKINSLQVGKQSDGAFIVSTEQRIEPGALAFDGRPTDMAMHPSGELCAILDLKKYRDARGEHACVTLLDRNGEIADSEARLSAGVDFRGITWSPDGSKLYASVSGDDRGYVQELSLEGRKLTLGAAIELSPPDEKMNARPGGSVVNKDGTRLYVTAMDRNAVVEIDLTTHRRIKEYRVQNLPYEVKLSDDEKSLIVTNWAGREPGDEDEMAASGSTMVVTDPRGAAASGTVSIIRLDSGNTVNFPVGLHPTSLLVNGNTAYVANSASDDISVVDVSAARQVRRIPLKWGTMNLFGSMPGAMTLRGSTLYICNGGDNALCQLNLTTGKVAGYRPAGYFPTAIALSRDGATAFVLNSKGNGSVRETVLGNKGNAHDFQGTVSLVNLKADLSAATNRVAANNGWGRDRKALNPDLAVYTGAIEHVLYIIKENRTYDQIFGDLPQGNGSAQLCDLGRRITPNHHALAEQYTLFDNGYVAGTNSADGHAWSTQSVANDYLEHFYDNYRTYPDDGDCAMSISSAGCLWDAALKKGKTFRDYGEFADDELAVFTPTVKSWLEVWKDRISGKRRIQASVNTRIKSLRPYLHPNVVYWPLLQSDQQRADLFIGEYKNLSRRDRVPNLMILTLPCDHTEGRDPNYPKPQSMVADNDLALGRVVDAVSHSPQWKNTCIFVIEDDAQSGYDHVDGHRTVFMAFSPFVKRKFVDHTMYNTCSMIRSIELMLGIDPMNRFDALTPPLSTCFTDKPDYTPYRFMPNQIPLDDMNPPASAQRGKELYWTKQSLALDWSGPDRANPAVLNRVLWHTLHGVDTPYPTR